MRAHERATRQPKDDALTCMKLVIAWARTDSDVTQIVNNITQIVSDVTQIA